MIANLLSRIVFHCHVSFLKNLWSLISSTPFFPSLSVLCNKENTTRKIYARIFHHRSKIWQRETYLYSNTNNSTHKNGSTSTTKSFSFFIFQFYFYLSEKKYNNFNTTSRKMALEGNRRKTQPHFSSTSMLRALHETELHTCSQSGQTEWTAAFNSCHNNLSNLSLCARRKAPVRVVHFHHPTYLSVRKAHIKLLAFSDISMSEGKLRERLWSIILP